MTAITRRRPLTNSDSLPRFGMAHGGDRIIGGVVCAGYIRLEEYVGFQWRHLRHTADPSLVGILDSARTAFANDIHASNLVALPA